MLEQTGNWDFQWGRIVARAWADDSFKQHLITDPARALREYDLTPPPGMRLEVWDNADRIPQDSEGVLHLVLPGKPSDLELSDDELCSGDDTVALERCWWCRRCGRCRCGWCGGCHHPPRPEEV